MGNILKRIILITLALALVALIVWVIVSSIGKEKDREYDEAQVKAAAKTLIKNTELLNRIYWGEGIPIADADAEGVFLPADKEYLENNGIKNHTDLKNLTRGTFTDGYCKEIFETLTDGFSGRLARYNPVKDEEGNETDGILVNKNWSRVWLKDTVVYDYDSIQVLRSEGERVFISIKCTVTSSEGKSQTKTLDGIALIEESDGWRIDSATYASYTAK